MQEKLLTYYGQEKINIDENSRLAEKFDVMSIPTMVVFKDGKEVERIVGARQQEQLEEIFSKFIK